MPKGEKDAQTNYTTMDRIAVIRELSRANGIDHDSSLDYPKSYDADLQKCYKEGQPWEQAALTLAEKYKWKVTGAMKTAAKEAGKVKPPSAVEAEEEADEKPVKKEKKAKKESPAAAVSTEQTQGESNKDKKKKKKDKKNKKPKPESTDEKPVPAAEGEDDSDDDE